MRVPPPSRGHKKTPSLPPLIHGRLPHASTWFCASVMNRLYSETSSHVKLRYKMSYKYVILGGVGGGGGGGGDAVESCSIEILISRTTFSHPSVI